MTAVAFSLNGDYFASGGHDEQVSSTSLHLAHGFSHKLMACVGHFFIVSSLQHIHSCIKLV